MYDGDGDGDDYDYMMMTMIMIMTMMVMKGRRGLQGRPGGSKDFSKYPGGSVPGLQAQS